MTGPDGLAPPLRDALDRVLGRIAARIAADVPADVRVAAVAGGVTLSGRALGTRALTDPRLRDFTAITRSLP